MKIKKFNEDVEQIKQQELYLAAVYYDGEFIEEESHIFESGINAADFMIKWCNDVYETEYEPFYGTDGDRFFAKIDDNPDWSKMLDFIEKENDDKNMIYLMEIPYHKSYHNLKFDKTY